MSFRFYCCLAGLIAYWIQTQFYLEGDVIYLIHAAEHWLSGGSYTQQFFETNPPLILYLYIPILWLKSSLGLNLVLSTRLYVFGLALLSLEASHYFIRRCNLQTRTRHYLLAALVLILFFLPLCEFAQREHLLLIFTLPYWFLMLARFQGVKIDKRAAISAGLAAGLGFGLKPFFLISPLALLICFSYRENRWRASLLPETLSLGLLLLLYLISIPILQPDYLQTIFPLVSKYYFLGAAEPWASLLERPPALFCLIVALFSPWVYRLVQAKQLALIISIALCGFILSFLLPKTAWYYHVLPALSMVLLLGALLSAEQNNRWMAAGLSLLFLIVPGLFAINVFFSDYAIRHNSALNQLIQFSQEQGSPSIYCIPAHHACSIASAYGHAHYVSRFPSFWALRGILAHTPTPQVEIDRQALLALLVQDLETKKPRLVVFDTSVDLNQMHSSSAYLHYLFQQSGFKQTWANYHYVTRFGHYEIYQRA